MRQAVVLVPVLAISCLVLLHTLHVLRYSVQTPTPQHYRVFVPGDSPQLDPADGSVLPCTPQQSRLRVLVAVFSRFSGVSQRALVRNTWADPLVSRLALRARAGTDTDALDVDADGAGAGPSASAQAIRAWQDIDVDLRFFLGAPGPEVSADVVAAVNREQAEFGDLLINPDVVDSTVTLWDKFMHMMRVAATGVGRGEGNSSDNSTGAGAGPRSAPYDYLIKVDDDVYLRADALLAELRCGVHRPPAADQPLYWGRMHFRGTVKQRPDEKWYQPADEFNERLYPPFALGPCYVVSGAIPRALVALHDLGLLQRIRIDDAALGVYLWHTRAWFEDDGRLPNLRHDWCSGHTLGVHTSSPVSFWRYHEQWRRTGRLC